MAKIRIHALAKELGVPSKDVVAFLTEKKIEVKHKWLIYFSIIIICWIPTLLAFYPCIISYDGGYQIRDFIFGQELRHHPILVTVLYTTFYNL